MIVIKRDGSEVAFNQQKIIDAIVAAMNSTKKKGDSELAQKIADKVTRKISKLEKVDIEHIQDEVQSAPDEQQKKGRRRGLHRLSRG